VVICFWPKNEVLRKKVPLLLAEPALLIEFFWKNGCKLSIDRELKNFEKGAAR
jgi:hypothetical protein